MNVIIDIECNSLVNPTNIWVIACKDISTGTYHIFREVTTNEKEKTSFLNFSRNVKKWIGHNWLGYDYPILHSLIGMSIDNLITNSCDTLIVSKMVDYSRPGHSIEQYGKEFGLEKGKFSDWTKYSKEMEEYCIRDVEICNRIYDLYRDIVTSDTWLSSLSLEQSFQLVVNDLHNNGFSFNTKRAERLLIKVNSELSLLDENILKEFPPKLTLIREIHPKETKHGTLSKVDFRFVKDGDLSEFNGGPFSHCKYVPFNPSSHKQIINVLNNAGWAPVDKTQTHIDTERELNRLKYQKNRSIEVDLKIQELYNKLESLERSGWKVNETNLATLPDKAPSPARTLAKRILLESRRRTLTEWLGLVQADGRIHGKFYGIGAWTHRMAHQQPNTANIPTEVKLYGNEMRSLWQAPRNRLLVGVDAEGIQLRIFAHYIDDKEFTDALVSGKKADKTDPHSLNQRVLGSICRSRQIAKRYIYALLLGAGIPKLASILECSETECKKALDNLLERYAGFALLKKKAIPRDAEHGYFIGLDGRKVNIPGKTQGERKHLVMSGYLQNGEAIVMKKACVKWTKEIANEETLNKVFIVNFVHDEWQTETPNDMELAVRVAEIQRRALREVGQELNLKCPLEGSYWSEDHNDYTIGTNWSKTH